MFKYQTDFLKLFNYNLFINFISYLFLFFLFLSMFKIFNFIIYFKWLHNYFHIYQRNICIQGRIYTFQRSWPNIYISAPITLKNA